MYIVNARFLTQPITGVQRFAVEISLLLKKKLKEDIKFVAPAGILNEDLAGKLGVNLCGNKKGHLWEQIDLPLYLRKNGNPLLLNFCNTAPILYRNKIVTVHDVAFKVFPKTYSRNFLIFYNFLIPRILYNSRQVITVSEFSKKEIIKYYKISSEKISVIYNAVANSFHPIYREDLKSQNYFLAVSSLNYRKNLELTLKAFNLYKQIYPSVKLFIVGGLDTKSFKTLSLEHYRSPDIKFLGRISDQELIEYYSNAKAFVYPSFYEGFGIPPLEAQACGAPVIVANDSCLPEVFGESALYCNPYDPQSLMHAMKKIENPDIVKNLMANATQNLQKYHWESSVDEVIKIIEKYR